MDKLSKGVKILIILAAVVAVFVVLNFGYFWANLEFFMHPPKPVVSQTVAHVVPQPNIAPNNLIIASLGITAPVQYATATGETAFQAALVNGPTHYPGTANPGAFGNCYIFGHSSDFIWSKGHYKNVFAVLPNIKIGASIIISDQQGKPFTYIVTASHEVAANDLSVLNQDYSKKLLTLQTSYPVGTALARWVVVAEIK